MATEPVARAGSNPLQNRSALGGISLASGSPAVKEEVEPRMSTIASTNGSTISRRAFLGGLVGAGLAAPLVVGAQQPERVYRVGMIERTPIGINAANVQAFRQGLRELGYVEGEHFVLEYRSADGQDQRFPGLAGELARLRVDLILTRGTPAALAVKNATATIPVVIIGVGDPVGQGLVASLAHPGGNITGFAGFDLSLIHI